MPVMPAHARLAALPVLALLMGAIALGSSPILVRLSELEPTATAFYRVALAAPAFLLISYTSGRSAVATHKSASVHNELLWLAVAGGFFALDLLCLHWSLRYTSVANATLFLNFAPFFVALGAWLVFGESPALRTVVSFAIAITGIFLLVGGVPAAKPGQHFGDLLGIGAGAAYGAYLLVVSRFRHRLSTSLVMGVTTISCAFALLPVAVLLGEGLTPPTLLAWTILLALALLTHAAGQGLLVFAMKYLPASTSSVTLLLQPVVAACGAWVIFQERLSFWQMVGAGVVLVGIVLCHNATRPRSESPENLESKHPR
jgi:drug/metabolite transporter (DMT)-like permease